VADVNPHAHPDRQRHHRHRRDAGAGDVWIEDGTVVALADPRQRAALKADRTIDATGRDVMPGGIDVPTHLDMPFMGTTTADDLESGAIAAAHGGTTSVVDFAIQGRCPPCGRAPGTAVLRTEAVVGGELDRPSRRGGRSARASRAGRRRLPPGPR